MAGQSEENRREVLRMAKECGTNSVPRQCLQGVELPSAMVELNSPQPPQGLLTHLVTQYTEPMGVKVRLIRRRYIPI